MSVLHPKNPTEKKNQAHPRFAARLVLLSFLLLYCLFVYLLCDQAASLYRPVFHTESIASGDPVPPPPLQGDIDLNTADQKTLETLPGIGEKLAQAMIDYRKEFQGFYYPEDVMYIHGIGEKKLEDIRPFITLSEVTHDAE